ncbi:DUF4180 domain-containing protein [Ottowia thiooxydans]|uniref:DUF4180 domain-containing protein n=1 Tax=Ottowia thiooxydans TaxID=219182 RepID=A0ABV2QCC5_9BURK
MEIRLFPNTNTPILELVGTISSLQEALDIVSSSYENDSSKILLRGKQLPPEFFDLQTRFAGEFIQKLVNYRFRIAGVFGEHEILNERFREYVAEARTGRQFRSFSTESEAIFWLENQ